MLHMKVAKRVNANSSHHKQENLYSTSLCIYMKSWMFTKFILVIISCITEIARKHSL